MRKAGNAAIGLFCRLGVHAAKHLTEGQLDGSIVRDYGTPATVRKLITVGLLHSHGHTCGRCEQPTEDGYIIHDYLDYNRSRAQIESAREHARKRQQKGRSRQRSERNSRDSDAILDSNSRENESSFAPNSRENEPLFGDETAGHGSTSRRDTHEGEAVVPSPPLPAQPQVVDAVREGAGSSSRPPGPDGPAPIDDAGFTVTDGMRRWAHRDGYAALIDIDHSTAQFVSHYRSTGAHRKSWPDAWQKWIRDDAKRAADRGQRPPSNVIALPTGQTLTGTDAKVAGWMAIAQQLRQEGDPA
ncbi:hypothetical protein ABT391_17935 [Streptomyces jumonjinensis]|uniref:hypothetical protein n=1 Tax=Streptomyces jumonjinensis TaxID=1945 RepID=UPI003331BF99